MKILIVDDAEIMLLLIQKFVSSLGHQAVTASNGQMAVEAYRAERPDLVLMDMMMPEMFLLLEIRGEYDNIRRGNDHMVRLWDEYNVDKDNMRDFENFIVEHIMTTWGNGNNWSKVHGGKYTKIYVTNPCKLDDERKSAISQRPKCKCGLPADICKKNDTIEYCCSRYCLRDWTLDCDLEIRPPCDYRSPCIMSGELLTPYSDYESLLHESWIWKIPQVYRGNRVQQAKECVVCGEDEYKPIYSNGYRACCWMCYDTKRVELKSRQSSFDGIEITTEALAIVKK
jgi:CheY-like chemotaxis protein